VDDRQQQIKEGAGLEESRINQDFVDFLNKWSTPVLLLIVIVSAGWVGLRWLEQQRVQRTDNAFMEYDAVAGAADPLPASLRAVADSYEGVGSVSALARLRLGDVHLAAVRRGLEPAAVLDRNGVPESEADVLDEAGLDDHLSRAASAYSGVLDETRDDPARALLAVNAMFGLAAVAEARGDDEAARSEYERAAAHASESGLVGLPEIAQSRIDSLAELPGRATLVSRADLPVLPGFPAPDPIVPEGDDATGQGAVGDADEGEGPVSGPDGDEPAGDDDE
jgi:hypothetical protein